MKNIIIMGAGRSGTSMLAGLFAKADYFFGGDVYPPRDSNPKGFYETKAVNSINEEILARVIPRRPPVIGNLFFRKRPGKYQRWLARLPLDAKLCADFEIQEKIGRLTRKTPYCFKDPRFSYTLPVWRPCLENNVLFCVFRDPAATVNSILKECATALYLKDLAINRNIALAVWTLMYAHVLERHSTQGQWMFIHYDQVFDQSVLEKISNVAGVEVDFGFPEKGLNRSAPDFTAGHQAMKIYQKLCKLADFVPVKRA